MPESRIEDYNNLELAADVVGIADALWDEKFFMVGHYWVAW